jgi:5'-nucleotidase (lipoprotein e(P4) family)
MMSPPPVYSITARYTAGRDGPTPGPRGKGLMQTRRSRCPLPLIILTLGTSLSGCSAPEQPAEAHEMLNATLWRQSSAEYRAIALQTFHLARSNLDQALVDPAWTAALEQTGHASALPPAIIADLDETILDNTGYEVRIIRRLGHYSAESFADWCNEVDAPAIPGAREFLDYATTRGVAVFYYSARKAALRDCTARNLRTLQLPFSDESRLLLSDGETKAHRRARIAARFRILLLLGDNLEDFTTGSKAEPAARRKLAERYTQRWGREWIVLPNPMYGHWEAAAYGFNYRLPRAEKLRRKRDLLQEPFVPQGANEP